MAEFVSLSVTDASNTARFPEGQAPSTVNNGARALEGMVARNLRDTQGYTTAGGTANALTIALNATTAAEAAGEHIRFKAAATNTAAATVVVTPSGGAARTARAIQRNAAALTGGEIIIGCYYELDWDGTQYQLANPNPVALISGRNLLINGEMKAAQRGASIAGPTNAYSLDGWKFTNNLGGPGVVTITQSTTVPNATFVNSLKIDVTTVDSSIAAGDQYGLAQYIEGLRCSRIGFGTAAAATVTLSFWFRSDSSDLTYPAVFGGSLFNDGQNRGYAFSFSQTTNATWQKQSITIPGDQSGTWLQTNGKGVGVMISLVCGTTNQGTLNTWTAAQVFGAPSTVNGMNHVNNDFYLTGMQLEVGSVATPFEYRDYGRELRQCQRYFHKHSSPASSIPISVGSCRSTTEMFFVYFHPEVMRAAPSIGTTGTAADYQVRDANTSIACSAVPALSGTSDAFMSSLTATVAAGLTAGDAGVFQGTSGTTAYLSFSAEL